jgi:hypothetical protein
MHRVDPVGGSMFAAFTVLLSTGLVGCDRGPDIVTSIEFDGESRNIATKDVICSKQPDGGLIIVVDGGPKRTVRVQLTQRGRLAVHKAGLRYDDMSGFVHDPREVTATKVDDTFNISGRMPPNEGESRWHLFKIQTSCPQYRDLPPMQEPGLGAP